MATWTDITNPQVSVGAPLSTALMTALRDNQVAFAERDTSAPKILGSAYNYQEFTVTGTWTKPSNAETGDKVYVQVVGGGGGGARDSAASSNGAGGGGGGAGVIFNIQDIDLLSSTESITVGAGGAGTTASSGDGTAGGDSIFSASATTNRFYIVAKGGSQGLDNSGGSGGGGFIRWNGSAASDEITNPDTSGGNASISTATDRQTDQSSVWGGGAGGSIGQFTDPHDGGFSQYAGYGGGAINSGTGAVADGTFPGGGGGAATTGATRSGDAGDGVVRVWCIKENP